MWRYQYQKACLSRGCEWLAQEDVLLRKKVALSYQERRQIAWTEVSKFIARAKLTKIPRTALECKERWMLISNNPAVTPSPQAIATNADSSMHHVNNNYSFNNYSYSQQSSNNSHQQQQQHNNQQHQHNNSNSQTIYYNNSGVPPSNSVPGSAVVVCWW